MFPDSAESKLSFVRDCSGSYAEFLLNGLYTANDDFLLQYRKVKNCHEKREGVHGRL